MKGIISKNSKGEWIVRWSNPEEYKEPLHEISLHPEDVKYAEEGKEVEFDITMNGWNPNRKDIIPERHVAKLILSKQQESWMDIFVKWQRQCTISRSNVDGLQEFLEKFYLPPQRINK